MNPAEKFTQEILANIARSEQAVSAAEELYRVGYYDFAASRAYYAVFYAATALLLQEKREFSKHSGVIAAIHRYFVKTGKFKKQVGRELNWLFELRSIGDYGVTVHVPEREAKLAIDAARRFVATTKPMIKTADDRLPGTKNRF